MYNVFLVEDEIVIREGIKNLIAWNEYGFNFAGEASDGELAWPLIQKQKPDIVITDIKMPFLDGLALSRIIKKELPETTIIILSGYDDFSYAKEAISIGVSQYLLKPLSKQQLIEVLRQVKEQKDKEQNQHCYLTQFNREIQEYLTSSRRDFFDALISGRYAISELLARAEKLNLNLTAERYNIILYLLEEDLIQAEYSTQLATVQSDLCECFPENSNVVMFSIGIDVIAFLIKADTNTIDQFTNQCVHTIKNISRPLEKAVKWSVVIGEPVERLSMVAGCYRTARQKLFHRDHSADSLGCVIDFNPNDMDVSKLDQRIVEKFLSSGLSEELDAFVEDYFHSIDYKAVESILFRQYVMLNVQFTANAFLKKLGFNKSTNEILQMDNLCLRDAILSLQNAKNYMRQLLKGILSLRDQAVNNRYNTMLQKALHYMKEHYDDPTICLNTVAKAANVSATHFSAVFSQQIGKTFVEYLTELRMDKARQMLRCTDKSSGNIAFAVGYNDPHYFSFLFKKVNGCTPRDYRSGRNLA